jgi:hypothetical protein
MYKEIKISKSEKSKFKIFLFDGIIPNIITAINNA